MNSLIDSLKKKIEMGKTIAFIFGFTFSINFCSGQFNFQDSSEVYNYWVKRGITEMVFIYMEDVNDKKGTLLAGEKRGMDDYATNFTDIEFRDVEKVKENFSKIKEFLDKNSWGNTSKFVFEPLKEKFEKRVKLDTTFFKIPANEGGEYTSENWAKKSNEIVNNYYNQLRKLERVNQENNSLNEEATTETIEKGIPLIKKFFKFHNWEQIIGGILIFFMGLFLGGILLYFISKKKINVLLEGERKEYMNLLKSKNVKFGIKYIGIVYILKLRKDHYKAEFEKKNLEINNVGNQLETLQKENLKLAEALANKKDTITKNTAERTIQTTREWDIKNEDKETCKLFFSMPESEGYFIASNGELSNDGRKYFKIEYHEKSDHGQLFYLPGERDKRAINRLESYLKPVCEIENILNADKATSINFISPGKVVLIDNHWVIDPKYKLKIKLV